MLPTLSDIVGRRKEWRAVIVCNQAGLYKQNPFDLVDEQPDRFHGPMRGMSAQAPTDGCDDTEIGADHFYSNEYKVFLEKEHQKKLRAYQQAATNPLTRLVTFFCNAPTVTKQEDSALLQGDADYARYIAENRMKAQLRRDILGDELTETAQPTEILCVAMRTYVSAQEEFENVWSSHTETEYSRFYDRNMYFDKMRYLLFDILPKTQRDYAFDYIRFLYATILLASNEIPSGCLTAERIYKLECQNDEQALCTLLQSYHTKLDITKDLLEQRIRALLEKTPQSLNDREVQQMFCAKVDQPIIIDDAFDRNDLYAETDRIGLANGCKTDEATLWDDEYRRSQKALARMIKLSRRSLKRATVTSRTQEELAYEQANLLNEFQLEDVQEFVDAQERDMLGANVVNLYEEDAIYREMEKQHQQVHQVIKTRMSRKTTLTLGISACLLFLLSFFTLFFKNDTLNALNFNTSLIFAATALGIFALIAVVTLFVLRAKVVRKIKDFNDLMHSMGNRIYASLDKYSEYLGYVFNIRRGNAVLNAAVDRENPDQDKIILYKKHISDIEKTKKEVREVFGQFMIGSTAVRSDLITAYEFNFDIPTEYSYALPYGEGTARRITFIQSGVSVEVPVEFVKHLVVRREELYE